MIGNSSSNEKNIVLTPSLLMRLFEWCHEDAANDVAMHKAFEKIISFNDGKNPLNMETYDIIIDGANDGQEPKATDEDLDNAEELGKEIADSGVNLDNVDYSDASFLINMKRGDEFGSSNDEIESFWKGYDGEEPTVEYDYTLPNGDKQVNHELCKRLENAVDSYHEGGISGAKCYDAIRKAFDDNEQCVDCSKPQFTAADIEKYNDSFGCENCTIIPGVEETTFTINCDDGKLCSDVVAQTAEEELPEEALEQIKQIVSLGGLQ